MGWTWKALVICVDALGEVAEMQTYGSDSYSERWGRAGKSQKPGETLMCYWCFYLEENLEPWNPLHKQGPSVQIRAGPLSLQCFVTAVYQWNFFPQQCVWDSDSLSSCIVRWKAWSWTHVVLQTQKKDGKTSQKLDATLQVLTPFAVLTILDSEFAWSASQRDVFFKWKDRMNPEHIWTNRQITLDKKFGDESGDAWGFIYYLSHMTI